jgi:hypothetical protein
MSWRGNQAWNPCSRNGEVHCSRMSQARLSHLHTLWAEGRAASGPAGLTFILDTGCFPQFALLTNLHDRYTADATEVPREFGV